MGNITLSKPSVYVSGLDYHEAGTDGEYTIFYTAVKAFVIVMFEDMKFVRKNITNISRSYQSNFVTCFLGGFLLSFI